MISRSRSVVASALIAIAAQITPACSSVAAPELEPLVVFESPGSKSQECDLVVTDLSGRELARQATGSTEPLPWLHPATAQVAFWRKDPAGIRSELVVWNISTRALKVVATYSGRPATSPVWSQDGTEIASLLTTTSISYMPGATFEGHAEVSVATVASGQARTVASDRPFMPTFANADVVSGGSFSGDKKFIAVDARTGQTLRELALPGAVGVLPTPSPDVIVAMRETNVPGEVTIHALDLRTGMELTRLGQGFAGPMPSWPGRNEIVFVIAQELRAFDYMKSSTRVVGPLGENAYVRYFDPLGKMILASRTREPFHGTFTVADTRLTSGFRAIPLTGLLSPLGLVRIKP